MSATEAGVDERPDGLRAIFLDGSLLYAARLVAQLSRLGYVLLVGRTLGPEPYGVLAYVLSWGLLFLPLVNMGSQSLLSRAFGRSPSAGRVLAQGLWTLRVAVLPALAALVLALGAGSEPDPTIRPLFLIVAVALVGRGLAIWGSHVLVANRRADRVLAVEAVFRLGEVLAAALALRWGVGIGGLLAIHAAGWWLQAGTSAWVSATIVRPAWRWRELARVALLRETLGVTVAGLAYFALLQGPVVVGRHVLGAAADLGHLALVMQLLTALATVPNAIGTASLPVLTGARAADAGRRFLALGVPASAVGAVALAAISALIGERALGFLFGERFAAAAPLLTLGILALLVPLAPATLLSHAALASARPQVLRRTAWAAIGGLAGGLLAASVIAEPWGARGVLLAAGAGALVWLLLLIGLLRRRAWGET